MSNQTNVVGHLDCPEVQEGILTSFSFWIEGITQVIIAMIGMVFNLLSMVILVDKEMRNRYVSKLVKGLSLGPAIFLGLGLKF